MRILALVALALFASCDHNSPVTKQVSKATPKVEKTAEGITIEQENIRAYREEFSDPNGIKYLYIVNDRGDCIFSDVVKGKVTSGGKRLRPRTVAAIDGRFVDRPHYGIPITIGGRQHYTAEVPSFDGTWGDSEHYLYWRNSAGQFRKLSLGAGMSVVTTTSPLRFMKSVIDLSLVDDKGDVVSKGQ